MLCLSLLRYSLSLSLFFAILKITLGKSLFRYPKQVNDVEESNVALDQLIYLNEFYNEDHYLASIRKNAAILGVPEDQVESQMNKLKTFNQLFDEGVTVDEIKEVSFKHKIQHNLDTLTRSILNQIY